MANERVMRGKISKRTVDALKAGDVLWDTDLKGFVARRLASGRVSYGLKFSEPRNGRQRWFALGLHGALTAEQARQRAQQERGKVAAGLDPQAEREAVRAKRKGIVTVNDLLDAHLKQYVVPRKLRTAKALSWAYDFYIRPKLGKVPVDDLKRSHVVQMLDRIAVENGLVTADRMLAYFRKALNWHATRDDNFVVPIVRGMARTRPRERARDRILDDNEIRALWKSTEPDREGNFGIVVRLLLLTAQRRSEVGGMTWDEIDGGVWTVSAERAKNNKPNAVPLSTSAVELLDEAESAGNHVFGYTGKSSYSGFTKGKAALDARMKVELAAGKPWKPWVLHDLRRTARSLMSRAGVRPEIAERVLNHVIQGVQGVYDRHDYAAEKKAALEALDALVLSIVGART
jgi:integrase